jgi:hypothetical protein
MTRRREHSCPYLDSNSNNIVKNLNTTGTENCNDISFQALVYYKNAFYFCIIHTDNLPLMSTIFSVNPCPGRDILLKISHSAMKFLYWVDFLDYSAGTRGKRILG